MFDTKYDWREDHLDKLDDEIRRVYPLLIADHCPCQSCTREYTHRIVKLLDEENFHPVRNDGDALYLLDFINFACWTIDKEYDFYGVSIYITSHPIIPDNMKIERFYPSLAESICLALIALYQQEFKEIRNEQEKYF